MNTKVVLAVGKSGQLARALSRLPVRSEYSYRFCGRPELDLTNVDNVERMMQTVAPILVVNTAAYTAVDKAESEPHLAHSVNAEGPACLAGVCKRADIPLIHVSTDYVFSGNSNRPYRADDPVDPQSVYGATKAAGEDAIRQILDKHIIIRTAWLYSEDGSNFLRTMLRLAEIHKTLNVVDDQRGSPTYAADLAIAIDTIVARILQEGDRSFWGTYHATNSGETSWHGFAEEIFRCARAFGHPGPVVNPIPSTDYPTPVKRPAYSVLDGHRLTQTFDIALPPWEEAVDRCVECFFSPASAEEQTVSPLGAS